MGYSATTEAFKTMDLIGDLLDQHQPHRVGSNEFWTEGGRIAFWEVGREQVDGSMTGSIHVDPTGNGTYVKVGGFKIHANGNLIRFPQLPKHIRDAVRNSEDRRNARFELQRQRVYAKLAGDTAEAWEAVQEFTGEWQRLTGIAFVALPRCEGQAMYAFVKGLSL
jgi:hypothetical protein